MLDGRFNMPTCVRRVNVGYISAMISCHKLQLQLQQQQQQPPYTSVRTHAVPCNVGEGTHSEPYLLKASGKRPRQADRHPPDRSTPALTLITLFQARRTEKDNTRGDTAENSVHSPFLLHSVCSCYGLAPLFAHGGH